jgi:hypothetical protein
LIASEAPRTAGGIFPSMTIDRWSVAASLMKIWGSFAGSLTL